MSKEMKNAKSQDNSKVTRKGCPLRSVPSAVRVQVKNLDNLLDRVCSGLVWNG